MTGWLEDAPATWRSTSRYVPAVAEGLEALTQHGELCGVSIRETGEADRYVYSSLSVAVEKMR